MSESHAGAGRPEKPIDWKRVEKLLMAGCSGTECAANFSIHEDTFYMRVKKEFGMNFTEYSSKFYQMGDSILREAQFDKAADKDNAMLIWLGKNRLKQSDRDFSKEMTEIKADLSRLTASLAAGRAQYVAEQQAGRSALPETEALD